MPKSYHLYISILFALLAVLNVYVGLVHFGLFSVVNFLIATYIGFRSYEEYKVYSEK